MNYEDFVKVLGASRTQVFSLDDAQRILNCKRAYASLFVSRNIKKGKLILIKKGTYAMPSSGYAEVATNIVKPSYMSMAAALYYRALVDQMPNEIIVINPIMSRKIILKIPEGTYAIRMVKVKPERMFGFAREESGKGFAYIASPEKAVADALHMPGYCPESYIDDALISGKIDADRLIGYARRMGSNALLKRLEVAAKRSGINIKL
jgi:predicted transcriptional regulator of viral defense system